MYLTDAADNPSSGVRALGDRCLWPLSVVSPDGTLLYVNRAAAATLGREPHELMGRNGLELVHPDDRERLVNELREVFAHQPSDNVTTYRMRAGPGAEWRSFESIATNLTDDSSVNGILLSSRDLTEVEAQARELHVAARRDPLTGLLNRTALNERIAEMDREGIPLAVAVVGIDRFKLINDTLGHAVGDTVLTTVAHRLRASAPALTLIGRFGGDLFALLMPSLGEADARSVLWRAIDRVGELLYVAGHEMRVSMSGGFVVRDPSATVDSLFRDADLALHRAKRLGGGRVEVFTTAMRDAAVGRLHIEADLRRAVRQGELALAIQPICRLHDRSARGAEALLRWRRPSQPTTPDEFIPVAEETGLIIPLGDWVIDRAAQLAPHVPGARLAVNLSPRQLMTPGLTDRVARALAAHRCPPQALAFEITETTLIEHFDVTYEVLQRLRGLGCSVGLDDFGSGYSSLGYLRRLPIDFLKLDKSLIADVDHDPGAVAIVRAVLAMADALGLHVVAEGIETEAQETVLRQLGCPSGQGYLLGRPKEV